MSAGSHGRDDGMQNAQSITGKPPSNATPFCSWMVAQRNRRRPGRMMSGNFGSPITVAPTAINGGDEGRRPVLAKSKGVNSVNKGGSHFSILNSQDDVQLVGEYPLTKLNHGPLQWNRL